MRKFTFWERLKWGGFFHELDCRSCRDSVATIVKEASVDPMTRKATPRAIGYQCSNMNYQVLSDYTPCDLFSAASYDCG